VSSSRNFSASPGVNCMNPSDVTRRYPGIGWYVSGRIWAHFVSFHFVLFTDLETYLTIFHGYHSNNIVRVTYSVQGRYIALIWEVLYQCPKYDAQFFC
jgi:hypothetical protein